MPAPIRGVQDVPADRQTPGGNAFKMCDDGHDEAKRDVACKACRGSGGMGSEARAGV